MKLFLLFVYSMFTSVSGHTFTLMDREKSYARLHSPMWKQNGKLHFNMKTNGKDGTICTIENQVGEIMRLISQKGLLQVLFDDIKQPVFTDSLEIKAHRWNHIRLHQSRDGLAIRVNHMTMEIPLTKRRWQVSYWKSVTIGEPLQERNEINSQRSIVGCIHLHTHKHDEKFIEIKQAILDGCIDACAVQSCQNGGECVNHYNAITCDCRSSGYTGKTCDIKAEAVKLDTSSFIIMKANLLDKDDEISIRFKTNFSSGILIATESEDELPLVELYNSSIYVAVQVATGVLRMNIGKDLHDGQWHHFQLSRNFHDVKLKLDSDVNVHAIIRGENNNVNLGEEESFLHFGGVVNPNDTIYSLSKKNFQGCLQQVFFGQNDVIRNSLRRHNPSYSTAGKIEPCHGSSG